MRSILTLLALTLLTPSHTNAVDFARTPPLVDGDAEDHNLNFVNRLTIHAELVSLDPGLKPILSAIGRELELPASLVASFVAIAEDTSWVERDMRYALHFSSGQEWGPLTRGSTRIAEYTRKALQRIALEQRIKRGEPATFAFTVEPDEAARVARGEITRRLPPRVQVLVGDRGPVGKTALYLYYTLNAKRERHALHDFVRASDLADFTQRKIALENRPVFIVDDWTRQDVDLQDTLLEVLKKQRDLFAGSSILIMMTSDKPITPKSSPHDLDPRLAQIADAIHFIPRPASAAAYARIIGRWSMRALDEDSRYAKLLALEAFELQRLADQSVILELKTALETGVARCQKSLSVDEDRQRQILHAEVKTYLDSRNPSY